MTRTTLMAAAAALAISGTARAEMKTGRFEYTQDGTVLQGFLAYDDAAKGKRPGILVVHEWWGHNDHAGTPRRSSRRRATSASRSTCSARAR